MVKIGVPSKGRLMEKTFEWFGARGLRMAKTGSDREYAGVVEGVAGVELVMLSASEVPRELAAGRIDLGVTGSDLVRDKLADWDRQVREVAALGFGPAGAVIYRMSDMVSHAWQAQPKATKGWVSDTLQNAARDAWRRVDWLPARLTAVAFAVVGNFEEAIDCWRNHAQRFPDDNDGVVLAATAGALNVRLGGEALGAAETDGSQDSESTPGRTPEMAHLSSVVGLVWRSVVLWMVLLALLPLARLLG